MANPGANNPYQFPEKFSSVSVGSAFFEGSKAYAYVDDFLHEQDFGFAADIAHAGLSPRQVESAVNAGRVAVAPWPQANPQTHFFWADGGYATA